MAREIITCRKCLAGKPSSEFYRGCRSCKECVRTRVRLRARTNPAVQKYDRERAKLPHRKAHLRRVVVKWRAENPQAYQALTALGNAIRDGKIRRNPCEVCGAEFVHAHYEDYAKVLQVRWLCPLHQHRLHADDPSAEGKNKRKNSCSQS